MKLNLVGGTDIGDVEAPAVWEDENGVERVLRDVLNEKERIPAVVVIWTDENGKIHVGANLDKVELTMGLVHRGLHFLSGWGAQVAERNSEAD